MRNVESDIRKYLVKISSYYYNKEVLDLNEKERHFCVSLSEYLAYLDAIIPNGYRRHTIFDIDGNIIGRDGEKYSIDDDIILRCKNSISKYCWNKKWNCIKEEYDKDKKKINRYLRENNVMDKRRENGNNVVISGTSVKPIGRTLIASIIMKEAIRARLVKQKRYYSYDWVDLDYLLNCIKNNSSDLKNYRDCDWLVVDNIIERNVSQKQNIFLSDTLGPFIFGRLYDKLPTIFVFKFDVEGRVSDIENMYGASFSSIINNRSTLKINLS